MAGSTSAYSAFTGLISDILSGVSQGIEAENVEDYNSKVAAYERELQRIQNENAARSQRVTARNSMMGQMGGGFESRAPKQTNLPVQPAPYSSDPMADYLQLGASIVGQVGDLVGGSSTSSSEDMFGSNQPVASTSAPPPTQVDTNYTSPMTDDQYAFKTRYNPNKYLS